VGAALAKRRSGQASARKGEIMNYLKVLRLAAMAAATLTAIVGVPSAHAVPKEFHANGAVALSGVMINSHVFTLTGGSVNCNNVTFSGTAAAGGTKETQNMVPEYKNCKAFGFINAVVNTAGCEYEFTANLATMNLHGCNNGGINIVVAGCSSFVPNQAGINGITYANTGVAPNRTLDVKTASNNIEANVTEANLFGCPLTAGGKHNNATYNGETGVMGAAGETFIE
jgi:hypothetical protein